MKKIISITILTLLLLVGCSGGEGSKEYVEAGQTVMVYPGDKLEPTAAGMKIKVEHDLDKNYKLVTVTQGTGVLFRSSPTP